MAAVLLFVDDHAGVAGQLRGLLEPEFEVVAVVGDGAALLTAAAAHRPDAIVTDVAMPCLDGIAAAGLILRHDPTARIVLVSVHEDAGVVGRGFAAGVLGFVSKVAAGEELSGRRTATSG